MVQWPLRFAKGTAQHVSHRNPPPQVGGFQDRPCGCQIAQPNPTAGFWLTTLLNRSQPVPLIECKAVFHGARKIVLVKLDRSRLPIHSLQAVRSTVGRGPRVAGDAAATPIEYAATCHLSASAHAGPTGGQLPDSPVGRFEVDQAGIVSVACDFGQYASCDVALSAHRYQEKGRPLVFDNDKSPIYQLDNTVYPGKEGRIYSGCFVNATVEIWAQDNKNGKGLRCTLLGIQRVRDGDAFGGGSRPDADDFDDVSEGADADDLS